MELVPVTHTQTHTRAEAETHGEADTHTALTQWALQIYLRVRALTLAAHKLEVSRLATQTNTHLTHTRARTRHFHVHCGTPQPEQTCFSTK